MAKTATLASVDYMRISLEQIRSRLVVAQTMARTAVKAVSDVQVMTDVGQVAGTAASLMQLSTLESDIDRRLRAVELVLDRLNSCTDEDVDDIREFRALLTPASSETIRPLMHAPAGTLLN